MIMSQGFTKIRNGLREHLKAGKFTPDDLGVWTYLQMACNYATGIYVGTSTGIAYGFGDAGDKTLIDRIQRSLARLRKGGYINYPKGSGKRKAYPILLDKFEPTYGEQSGMRLNAWKYEDKVAPYYEPEDGGQTDYEQWDDGEQTEDEQSDDSGRTEGGRIPYIHTSDTPDIKPLQTPDSPLDECENGEEDFPLKDETKEVLPLKDGTKEVLTLVVNKRPKQPQPRILKFAPEQPLRLTKDRAKTKVKDPATLPNIQEWDEDRCGIPAERLRNCIAYLLSQDWWKSDITIGSMRNDNFVRMIHEKTPAGWTLEGVKKQKQKKHEGLLGFETVGLKFEDEDE